MMSRTSKVRLEQAFIEKIDPMDTGKLVTDPRGLAGAARPEEKERLGGWAEKPLDIVMCHDAVS
jgi:hypothetical protein